jgi:hypothetical protein
MVLSAVIFTSIYAATWAQDVYLREQAALVAGIKAGFPLSKADVLALQAYERTMVGNRRSASGRMVGGRVHALVRVTPLILPIGFSLLWLYAYCFAPHQ